MIITIKLARAKNLTSRNCWLFVSGFWDWGIILDCHKGLGFVLFTGKDIGNAIIKDLL